MPEIVLTEEQWKLVAAANRRVEVKDPSGRVLGTVEPPPTAEQIAEWKRLASMPGPRYTGEQVQARLRALEMEWERTGGFSPEYAQEYLKQLNERDPGHFRNREAGGWLLPSTGKIHRWRC